MPEKNLLDLAQCLSLLEIKEGDLVFDYNSEGDLFYIILEGTVSVLIPDQGNTYFLFSTKGSKVVLSSSYVYVFKNRNRYLLSKYKHIS
jgi:hypothetical protein